MLLICPIVSHICFIKHALFWPGTDSLILQFDASRDGSHGRNAAPAIRGGPAGFMAVELWESNIIPEGIHARVLRCDARQQPPPSVEVPTKRDVLFTAIGGAGEAGNVGGDGQPGMDGTDGSPATREIDATVRLFFVTDALRLSTIALF